MELFERFENQLKANPKTIVFTEGPDARILSAASRLLAGGVLKVILLGNVEEVKAAATAGGFDITGAEIIDPVTYEGLDEMVAKMVELRKGKMTEEQCRDAMAKGNYVRHHAGQDGQGRLPAGRRHLFHRRYRSPRSAADQVQARHQVRQLLLHSGARR